MLVTHRGQRVNKKILVNRYIRNEMLQMGKKEDRSSTRDRRNRLFETKSCLINNKEKHIKY